MLTFGFLKKNRVDQWIERAIQVIIVFALISVPLFINPWAIEQFDINKVLLFQALIEIAFFLWVALLLIRRTMPQFTPLTIAIFSYLFVVSVSAFIGADPLKSIWGSAEEGIGIIALWHFFAFYLVAASLSWRPYYRLVSVLFWTGVATACIGFFQKYIWWPDTIFWPGISGERIASTFSNAPHFAAFLLFIVFFGLFLLTTTKNRRLQYVYGIGTILATIAIFLTKTRGSIIALLGGLCVLLLFFVIRGKHTKIPRTAISLRQASAGTLIILALLGGILLASRSASIWREVPGIDRLVSRSTEKNLKDRMEMWRIAPKALQERPMLGIGWRNSDILFNKLGTQVSPAITTTNDKPFNVLLEHLITGGLLGFAAYLGIFFALAYQMKKTWKNSSIFLAAAIVGSILQNLVLFDTVASYIPLFLLFAFIDAEYRDIPRECVRGVLSPAISYGIVVLAIILSFVPIYTINWRTALANHNYYWGVHYLERNQFEQSHAHFSIALQTKMPYADQMALDYAERAATKSRSKEFSENMNFVSLNKMVARQLEAYTNQHPSSFQYHFTLGTFYLAFRDYDTTYLANADKHLQAASALAPQKAGAYLAAASLHLINGASDKASEAIQVAIDLSERVGGDERIIRAILYANLGKERDSYIELMKALASGVYPTRSSEYIILGDVSANQHDYYTAIDLYAKALESGYVRQTRKWNTLFKLGLLFQKIGESQKAYEILTQLRQNLLDHKEYAAMYQIEEILKTF